MSSNAFESASLDRRTPAERLFYERFRKQEYQQFLDFLECDIAHVLMLLQQGLLSQKDGTALVWGLQQIRQRGVANLRPSVAGESLFDQVEAELGELVSPETAGRLQTARSRIDQSATITRLATRTALIRIMKKLLAVMGALLVEAEKHAGVIIQYYTHTQPAQPGTVDHFYLAQFHYFSLVVKRFQNAFKLLNCNPLGTVARSGTEMKIDRQCTAELLGFDDLVDNSMLGRDATWAADLLFACSMSSAHADHLASDFLDWKNKKFMRLPKGFYSGSSAMPQKENPITLDGIRVSAGEATQYVAETQALWRGAKSSGDQMLHGAPACLSRALTTIMVQLENLEETIPAVVFDAQHMLKVVRKSWSTSNNLADKLAARQDVPFRMAHKITGQLVRRCLEEKIRPSDVTPQLLQEAGRACGKDGINMTAKELHDALDPETFVATRTSTGSVGPAQCKRMLDEAKVKLRLDHDWVNGVVDKLKGADFLREKAVEHLLDVAGPEMEGAIMRRARSVAKMSTLTWLRKEERTAPRLSVKQSLALLSR